MARCGYRMGQQFVIHILSREYWVTHVQGKPLLLERFFNCPPSLRYPVIGRGTLISANEV